MTNELRKAMEKVRSADQSGSIDRAEEVFTEALQKFAESCRRDTIQRCCTIARARGAGDVADDLLSLMEEV